MDPRLLRLIEEWACNVTRAVAEKKNCISYDFLRVTCVMGTKSSQFISRVGRIKNAGH